MFQNGLGWGGGGNGKNLERVDFEKVGGGLVPCGCVANLPSGAADTAYGVGTIPIFRSRVLLTKVSNGERGRPAGVLGFSCGEFRFDYVYCRGEVLFRRRLYVRAERVGGAFNGRFKVPIARWYGNVRRCVLDVRTYGRWQV